MEMMSQGEKNRFQGFAREEIVDLRELFLSAEEGLSFTDFCEREDLAIVGIEGGKYDGSFTPDLDLIQDYSEQTVYDWMHFRRNCNKQARVFLVRYIGDVTRRFYLVVVSKEERLNGEVAQGDNRRHES